MYTLERGLGWRWMGILFALFTAIAAFGIGCTVQANAISTIMHASYGISTEVSGGVLMLLAAAVIIGGVRSISKVCSMLVPFMALHAVCSAMSRALVRHLSLQQLHAQRIPYAKLWFLQLAHFGIPW